MGKLSIVGVSIGNLEDITFRSLRYIFESEVILAEDTHVFTKLKGLVKQRFEKVLEALEIDAKKHSYIISYREQNHDRVINQILALLAENKTVSLFPTPECR